MGEAICPKCGKTLTDLYEYEEGLHKIECGWCEAPLRLSVSVSIDYDLEERSDDSAVDARREP